LAQAINLYFLTEQYRVEEDPVCFHTYAQTYLRA
jgi:hypothetical protein